MFGDEGDDELLPPDPLVQWALGLIAVGVVACGLVLAAVVLMAPGVFAEWGMSLSGEYDIPCVRGMTVEAADQYIRNYDPPLTPFRVGHVRHEGRAGAHEAIVVRQQPACGAIATKPTAVDILTSR